MTISPCVLKVDFPYFGGTNVDGTTENVQEKRKGGRKSQDDTHFLPIPISNKHGSLRERTRKEAIYCILD